MACDSNTLSAFFGGDDQTPKGPDPAPDLRSWTRRERGTGGWISHGRTTGDAVQADQCGKPLRWNDQRHEPVQG